MRFYSRCPKCNAHVAGCKVIKLNLFIPTSVDTLCTNCSGANCKKDNIHTSFYITFEANGICKFCLEEEKNESNGNRVKKRT